LASKVHLYFCWQGNELLHEVFEFQPRGQNRQAMSTKEKVRLFAKSGLSVSFGDEVVIDTKAVYIWLVALKEVVNCTSGLFLQRMYMSPNSVISKARTQTRNRSRSLAQVSVSFVKEELRAVRIIEFLLQTIFVC
jgi:hypothetical protein